MRPGLRTRIDLPRAGAQRDTGTCSWELYFVRETKSALDSEKRRNKEAKPPDKKWLKGKYEKYRKLMQHETVATASAPSG